MKAIIVGAHGQLGRELIRQVPPDVLCIGLGRAELDITDPVAVGAMMELYRPDLVLNAAAYTAVDRAESEEADAFAINAAGVRNLTHAAKDHGAHLLHVSTDFVFDGSTNRAYRPGAIATPCRSTAVAKRQARTQSVPTARSCARHGSTERTALISSRPCSA